MTKKTKKTKDGIRFLLIGIHSIHADNNGHVCGLASPGILYLSSVLKKNGHETYILYIRNFDEALFGAVHPNFLPYYLPNVYPLMHQPISNKDIEIMLDAIKKIKPDAIGISLCIVSKPIAIKITKAIKNKFNDIPIIWGGTHPTIYPADAIKYCDAVCIGPGERAIVEIADKLRNNESIEKIKNLWVKKEDGKIIRNPVRAEVDSLDSLPLPDLDLEHKYYIHHKLSKNPIKLKPENMTTHLTVTSRGCTNSCTYCCNHMIRKCYPYIKYTERRSPENVIAELLEAKLRFSNLSYILFYDDIFTLNHEWLKKFLNIYKEKIGLNFFCHGYPTAITKEIVKLLRDAGCDLMLIGIQSGSHRTLYDIYNRYTPKKTIINSIKLVYEAGINVLTDLIVDNPYETEADLKETFELLMELPRGIYIHQYRLALIPGSALDEKIKRDGLLDKEDPYPYLTLNNLSYEDDLKITGEYERSKEHDFWYIMMALTQSDLLSKRTLRILEKTKWFKSHPKQLLKFLQIWSNVKARLRRP